MKNTLKIFVFTSFMSIFFFGCNRHNNQIEINEKNIPDNPKINSLKENSVFEPIVTGYENLIEKAKEYERNEEYIYSCGYYFDAMEEADSEEDKNFANENIERIGEDLKDGSIGLKNQSVFDIRKSKKDIIFEYYKYFTEFCPFYFHFGNFEQKSLNFESRTSDFVCEFQKEDSAKFKKLKEIANSAFKDSPYNEYNAAEFYSSDREEAIKMASENIIKNNYFLGGIAYLDIRFLDNEQLLPSFEAEFWCGKSLSQYTENYMYFPSTHDSFQNTFSAPYILDISIVDREGKVLKSIKNFLAYDARISQVFDFFDEENEFKYFNSYVSYDDSNKYSYKERFRLNNVPENLIPKFKSNEAQIQIDKIYMPYGSMSITYNQNISLTEVYKMPKIPVKFKAGYTGNELEQYTLTNSVGDYYIAGYSVSLAYKKYDNFAAVEIPQKNTELCELFNQYFTEKTYDELESQNLKVEIINKINNEFLTSSKIQDISFYRYY